MTSISVSTAPFSRDVLMSSREIAELTDKHHLHVLRDIRNLLESLDYPTLDSGLVFQETTEPDSQGIQRPVFLLNRKAALFLVTKYDDARRLKVINRLEELEVALLGHSPTTGRFDGVLTAEQVAHRVLETRLRVGALLGVPLHIAQVEGVKAVARTTGVDYSPLLLHAPAQNDVAADDVMLEPTDLAKLLGVRSGKELNRLLASLGLQERQGDGWVPTSTGAPFCARHQWSVGSKSGYNLKWRLGAVQRVLTRVAPRSAA